MSEREEGFKFFRSLADRYVGLVKKLDAIVGEAIMLLEKAKQSAEPLENQNLQKAVGLLDEAVFQLHVWASDLTYQNFFSRSGNLAMRELNTDDVLNIIDASQMPIAGGLHRTFEQIENNCLIFSRTLASMTTFDRYKWASYCATLDEAAGSIEHALLELDKQKPKIREQINRTTAEDMERGLSNDRLISGKASVLSIDGGGISSYSSILIIRALMEEVRFILRDEKTDDVHSPGVVSTEIRPSDVFEYIFGSSSGGLIAIMLGRLKMSEDQCLESFQRYAHEVFSHRRLYRRLFAWRIVPKYSSDNLSRAIKMVVGNFNPGPDGHKWKRNLFAVPGEKCKTGVTAYALQGNGASTHIFRTYSHPPNHEKSSPWPATKHEIWEVARATSAAPFYFHPMIIGQIPFIDGGFGTNNPTLEALDEIQAFRKALSPSIRLPKLLIISVGSGVRSQAPVLDSSNSRSNLTIAAKSLITDTEPTHRDMKVISETQGIDYFRFSVDSGLSNLDIDSWKVRDMDGKKTFATVEAITEATESYLKQKNVVNQLRQCARLLVDRCRSNPFSSQPALSLPTIPFPQDRDFVGREGILDRVQVAFQNYNHVVLVGLGGIGKTCIAIEYGHRYRIRHPSRSVFWVRADISSHFEQDLRSIAEILKIPIRGEAKADVFRLVYNWLRYDAVDGWLMILDNTDDENIFGLTFGGEMLRAGGMSGEPSVPMSPFLPQNPKGQILITSRSKDVASELSGNYNAVIEVGPMSAAESIDLFFTKFAGNCARSEAQELTRVLEFIPLAISQAAGYLNYRAPRFTISGYLAEFRGEQKRLLSTDTRHVGRYDRSLSTVWETTFEKIRGHKPSAWRLLCLMSLCGPHDIPDYLVHDDQETGNDGSKNTMDLDFEDDIATLTSYSLIKINSGGNLFSIHRLVQSEIRIWLEKSQQLIEWKQKYIVILAKVFPATIYEDWPRCKALFTHVNTALTYRPADDRYLRHWNTILVRVARYAEAVGDYDKAEKLNIQALEESERFLGPEDPKTLESIANLALLYIHKGRYKEAGYLSRRALDGRQKILGLDDPDTLVSQDYVARVLLEKGDYTAAEEIFQRGLDTRRRLLGEQHPDTFISLHNLALVFREQGNFQEAESFIRQAVEGLRKTLGTEHPHTLSAIGDLASVLQGQGHLKEAEMTNQQALRELEMTLGSEHPRTLIVIGNLALILRDQEEAKAAEGMTRRALKGLEKTLGSEHPETLTVIGNLALIFQDQGRVEEAEDMTRRALEGLEKTLGSEHPRTLIVMCNLAMILQVQGKVEAAEEMTRRALTGLVKTLGSEHPRTLIVIGNPALISQDQGRVEVAEAMTRQALKVQEKMLGKEHRDTMKNANRLALILDQQGKHQPAKEIYQQTSEVVRVEHPDAKRANLLAPAQEVLADC